MFDTNVRSTSESYSAAACSPANLVTLRDGENKIWVIQKELIAFIREDKYGKECRVVLSNQEWFSVPMAAESLVTALGLQSLPPV